jgi:hypothetical protein
VDEPSFDTEGLFDQDYLHFYAEQPVCCTWGARTAIAP